MARITLPNKLTLARIGFIPFLVAALLLEDGPVLSLAAAIFAVAAVLDGLDGYLARCRGEVTTMGKMLDPAADKLLVMAAMIPLVQLGRVAAWTAVIVLGREMLITGLRSIAAAQGVVIQAGAFGKQKMLAQVFAMLLLMIHVPVAGVSIHAVGTGILWYSIMLSVISGVQYTVDFVNFARRTPAPDEAPRS